MSEIPQFGVKPPEYRERPCAYALILNDGGQMLAVEVEGTYYLPGGGIDAGEAPEHALVREAQEETGYDIALQGCIGKANEYFAKTDLGPLNKIAVFYKATIQGETPSKKVEANHNVHWLSPKEFMALPTNEFQRWAVQAVCGKAGA